MLATPGPNGDAVLESAILASAAAGLLSPGHHVVVLQQIHEDFCVKVCWVVGLVWFGRKGEEQELWSMATRNHRMGRPMLPSAQHTATADATACVRQPLPPRPVHAWPACIADHDPGCQRAARGWVARPQGQQGWQGVSRAAPQEPPRAQQQQHWWVCGRHRLKGGLKCARAVVSCTTSAPPCPTTAAPACAGHSSQTHRCPAGQ
jgi:hypothetical protein